MGGHGHDAAVHLLNLALRLGRVFVLDDGLHLSALTHDAAVARRIGKVDGQQGQLLAAALLNQRLQGVGLRQGHIARQNHHHAIVGQCRHSLLHSVTGAQLGFLAHTLHRHGLARCQQQGLDLVGTVPGNDHGRAGVQLRGGVQHMLHQRHTRQALQYFGQAAFHAGAFASRHHDDINGELG